MRTSTALPMTLALLALSGGMVPRASAAPTLVQPGYALTKVSTGAPASGIAQLAFRPGDPARLYAARTSGSSRDTTTIRRMDDSPTRATSPPRPGM